MAATTEAVVPRDDLHLTITRMLDAPVELAFEVWTKPEHLARWWGPKGATVTAFEMDFQEGGAWRSTMSHPEWGDFGMAGTYREIAAPNRLVFTFKWDGDSGEQIDTVITATFEAMGDKTRFTFHQTPFSSEESRDSHLGGWGECMDRLEAYIGEAAA